MAGRGQASKKPVTARVLIGLLLALGIEGFMGVRLPGRSLRPGDWASADRANRGSG